MPKMRSTRQQRSSRTRLSEMPTGARLTTERVTMTKSKMLQALVTKGPHQLAKRLKSSSAVKAMTRTRSIVFRTARRLALRASSALCRLSCASAMLTAKFCAETASVW